MTSSFNVSGLLGGTAASIDTTTLISQLMQGAALPQTELKDQLTSLTTVQNAYQAINTNTALMQSAAQALTDATAWNATTATSSTTSMVATSNATASPGTTTFNVTQLAQSQLDTVSADGSGNFVSNLSDGITITGSDNQPHTVYPDADSAASVAAAINANPIGVHATVITADGGTRLQLTSSKSGAVGSFTSSGFTSDAQPLVTAKDAQITVGDTAGTDTGNSYTISSSSNTFTGVIPGVTFSVSALANNVSVSVTSDQSSISDKVKALVTAANSLGSMLATDDAQGGVLEGQSNPRTLATSLMSAVSGGWSTGGSAGTSGSLSMYGIDMDKNGVFSFDAKTFATAYAADPTGTQAAISGSYATNLNAAADAAIAPITGSVTQALSDGATQATSLNTQITDWTPKLALMQTALQQKYTTMQVALAKLQSQQSYLTSMFNGITNSQSSSSSSG